MSLKSKSCAASTWLQCPTTVFAASVLDYSPVTVRYIYMRCTIADKATL